jgi:hypothetical protein
MPGKNFAVLDILRLELEFLKLGLYRAPTPAAPLSIFQDSPACPGHGVATCANCVLMQFVPSEDRSEPVPCHYIRLNEACETVDSLYRTGTQKELEEALRNWLTATITKLEGEQIQARKIIRVEKPPRKSAA